MMHPTYISNFWNLLWRQYLTRVSYARVYQEMITNAQGTVANDHIAFRSLRLNIDTPNGEVNLGIKLFEPLLNILGYSPADEYLFPNHLYARYYRHPQQEEYDLPKLFISELIVEQLPSDIATLIYDTVEGANLEHTNFEADKSINPTQIFTRPWQPPLRSVVEKVNSLSQYGAWVLLHGYAVNHFTGYVNRQNTPQYPDIETTARGLVNLGVPMKAEIEGNISVGLRQTATQAVTELVTVRDETNLLTLIPWTYAYYEIAERYMVESVGKQILFDGFLGNNAKQLFEMTKFHKQ
ncbi:hypothetical protein NIES4071_53130 [Calothrix sp. NIES-4071]|nr:hypothetical protein NIES4071_53130 [Calothrix sp. NIES-4071]BAZ59621.1 hypothetical protein NIES4105_53080 [Calothrix sp. NIES-4105]